MYSEPVKSVSWSSMAAPLMKLGRDGEVAAFIGTGFVPAASERVFITARHVIERNPLAEGEKYYVYFQADDGSEIQKGGSGDGVMLSSRYDVAALPIGEVPGVRALYLDPTEIPMNEKVVCREYSGNYFRAHDGGKKTAVFHPRTHVGNVMSWYTSKYPEKHPAPSVELSFPALQGASGAPVIRDYGLHVIAMLVANVEQELTPAQVLSVHREGECLLEEVRYFLPIGKGLCSAAIIEFLEQECEIRCAEPPPLYLQGEVL